MTNLSDSSRNQFLTFEQVKRDTIKLEVLNFREKKPKVVFWNFNHLSWEVKIKPRTILAPFEVKYQKFVVDLLGESR